MKLGVPKETRPGEQRVALVPGELGRLGAGVDVLVQRGAGELALYSDKDYQAAGATLVDGAAELYRAAELVVKVQPPTLEEVDLLSEETSLLSFLAPSAYLDVVKATGQPQDNGLQLRAGARISRAQVMDVLSSQATVAGYRAVLWRPTARPSSSRSL